MKKTIRSAVFETNSSSVHTVSIKGDFSKKIELDISENITCYMKEYGWHGSPCHGFLEKLSYAMLIVLHTEYPDFRYYDEDFYINEDILEKLDGYQLLLNTINAYNNKKCKKITIYRDSDSYYPYGYIDHQSHEDYDCLQDFFDDWEITPERFLFDDKVVVYISNDNC